MLVLNMLERTSVCRLGWHRSKHPVDLIPVDHFISDRIKKNVIIEMAQYI